MAYTNKILKSGDGVGQGPCTAKCNNVYNTLTQNMQIIDSENGSMHNMYIQMAWKVRRVT